jgi:hypothetical protein
MIPDFKLYYRTIVIKTTWYWHKNRHEDQWNRMEDPNTNPHNYSHLTFNKGAQDMCLRKDNKCCGENWISTCRRLQLDPNLSPCCTSNNSKWINVRSETVKLIQEKIGNILDHIGIDGTRELHVK